jgi:hypothetical protein
LRLRGYLFYGVLFAIIAALTVAARDRGTVDDRPSIESNGPNGLRALYLYLQESGRAVSGLEVELSHRDPTLRTLVVAAPTERPLGKDDADGLLAFVESGGTLVYLTPRSRETALDERLKLHRGGRLSGRTATAPDAEVAVWHAAGVLTGTKTLVLAPEETVEVRDGHALPVAGQQGKPALWHEQRGKGELWIAAGADLAANSRIAQGDNLAFWDHLAQRGPIAFDERLQRPPPPVPMSRAALAFAGQFLLVGLLFAWARGVRLGPPRMPPEVRHRASREYLTAFGSLLRRAKVEGELAGEMRVRLRRELQERVGIPLTLPDGEAVRALEQSTGISAAEVLSLLHALDEAAARTPSSRELLALSQRLARLEAALTGRRTLPAAKVA